MKGYPMRIQNYCETLNQLIPDEKIRNEVLNATVLLIHNVLLTVQNLNNRKINLTCLEEML